MMARLSNFAVLLIYRWCGRLQILQTLCLINCVQAGTFTVASDNVLQSRDRIKAKRRCNV